MKRARPFGLAFVASRISVCAAVACLLVGVAAVAEGQRVPTISIGPKNASIDDGFTSLWSLRELSDGRVLFTDVAENRLYLADFSTGELRSIGLPGSGPGEVRYFERIHPLAGDSTLVVDGTGARWVVYHRDKPARTYPPDHPLLAVTRNSGGSVVGGAADGTLLVVQHDRRTQRNRTEYPNGYGFLDSGNVMRVRPGARRGDVLGRIQSRDERTIVGEVRGRPFYTILPAYYSTPDRATIAPDGWVAVASQRPYRVTWWSPTGERIVGPDLAWPVLRITAAEKEAYARRERGPSAQVSQMNAHGWVDAIPPFGGRFGASHSPDGRLFLRKMPTAADERTRYDVIDRTGRIVGELVLPANEYLAGFGARSVYKVVKDEDDLLHLQRHPWP